MAHFETCISFSAWQEALPGLLEKPLGNAWALDCASLMAARAVGYLIMAGAVGLKLPQILNIVSTGSVEGLSPLAFYAEVPLTTTTIAYNYLRGYPFSSYGETVFICLQNLILVALLWAHTKPRPSVLEIVGVLTIFLVALFGSLNVPADIRENLQFFLSNGLLVASRVPQIIKNARESSTGQLSSITTFMMFAGTIARILTTLKEVGWNWTLLSSLFLSLTLSSLLLMQMWLYSESGKTKTGTKAKTKTKEAEKKISETTSTSTKMKKQQ